MRASRSARPGTPRAPTRSRRCWSPETSGTSRATAAAQTPELTERLRRLVPATARTAAARLRLLFGSGVPLGDFTRVLAHGFGERPALAEVTGAPGLPGRPRTYAELEDDVARLAAAHRAAALPGDAPVAVLCANRVDLVLHALALARVGASPLPINHRLRPAEQAAAMEAAGVRRVVADGDLAAALPGKFEVSWTGVGESPAGAFDLAGWLRDHPRERWSERAAGDVPLLLLTSGTTGQPKVVRLTSRSLLGAIGRLHALPVGYRRGLRPGRDKMLMALPLTHVMGLATLLAGFASGIEVMVLDRFEARAVLGRIEDDAPNVFVGVPTMYADLEAAGAAERDLSSVELWVSAADVMPPDRARRFQKYGALVRPAGRRLGTAVFADVYGMVELGGPAAVRLYPPGPRVRDLPALGLVLPGFSARAVGTDGRALRLGVAGELQLRGPAVFTGYAGAQRQQDGGWFSTGDLARLGPGGIFAFVGRKADRIKVGGFSVFPAEVETELRGHPSVAELAIVGVPDERLGEHPVALVVPRGKFEEEEFLEWAAQRVAPYRRPRKAIAVQQIPVGKNGKVDRRGATELARKLLG